MAIIPSKHIQRVFIHDSRVRMSSSGRSLVIVTRKHFLPRVIVNVVLKEIIDSVETVIASKDEDGPRVDDRHVSVSRGGRHVVCFDLSPPVVVDVVAVEVILPRHPVIAPKQVNLVFKSHTWMERSLRIKRLTAEGVSEIWSLLMISYQQWSWGTKSSSSLMSLWFWALWEDASIPYLIFDCVINERCWRSIVNWGDIKSWGTGAFEWN